MPNLLLVFIVAIYIASSEDIEKVTKENACLTLNQALQKEYKSRIESFIKEKPALNPRDLRLKVLERAFFSCMYTINYAEAKEVMKESTTDYSLFMHHVPVGGGEGFKTDAQLKLDKSYVLKKAEIMKRLSGIKRNRISKSKEDL